MRAGGRPASAARVELARSLLALALRALDEGNVPPWRTPWDTGLGQHCSGATGRAYQSSNAWSTWATALAGGLAGRTWYTAARVAREGWRVRPGAPAARVYVPKPSSSPLGGRGARFEPEWVLNSASLEGCPPDRACASPWCDAAAARVLALFVRAGAGLAVGAGAAYVPASDTVILPLATAFPDVSAWAGTALHELVHWTGHPARLARPLVSHRHDPTGYAREELVAELGAAIAGADLGLRATRADDDPHVAYLASWGAVVRDEPAVFDRALDAALQAVDLLRALAPPASEGRPTAPLSASEVPRSLPAAPCWADRSTPLRAPAPVAPPPLGPTSERWPTVAPDGRARTLAIVGAPGDGAASVAAELAREMGAAPAPAGALRLCARRVPTDDGGPRAFTVYELGPADGHPEDGLAPLPAGAEQGLRALADAGRPFPTILAGRGPLAEEDWRVTVDLGRAPRPAAVARALLAKLDPRPWTAAVARHPADAAHLEDWSGRLRTPVRRRLGATLVETAPFAPITLWAAQAGLDLLWDRGEDPGVSLEGLVEAALRRAPGVEVGRLLALDDLLGGPDGHALDGRVAWLRAWLADHLPEARLGPVTLASFLLRELGELETLAARIAAAPK